VAERRFYAHIQFFNRQKMAGMGRIWIMVNESMVNGLMVNGLIVNGLMVNESMVNDQWVNGQ